MTYEHCLQLFRKGQLRKLIQAITDGRRLQDIETNVRVLLGYTLAIVGDTSLARSVVETEPPRLAPNVRSQFECALAIIGWRAGDADAAWKHFNLAIHAAVESKDLERIAWAHLHLLRFAVDTRPADALTVILPQARSAVVRAGIPSLTAYLHTCVATMEGNCGRIDEALRHCDLAESLLELESNAWVLGVTLLNKGSIAIVRCEFAKAANYFHSAIAQVDVNGSSRTHAGAETNLGYIYMLTGEYRKAEVILKRVLERIAEPNAVIDSTDTLARVYLGLGNLDECEATLRRLDLEDNSVHYAKYATRWTALTKAQLLLKSHNYRGALTWLESMERKSSTFHDRPFMAALHLHSAYTLHRMDRGRDCARRILSAHLAGIRERTELQGQFHYTLAQIVANESYLLSAGLEQRGTRIWSSQGIAPTPLEIRDTTETSSNSSKTPELDDTHTDRVRAAINSLAAAFDVAAKPTLLAREILRALDLSGYSRHSSVIETTDLVTHGIDDRQGRIVFPLADTDDSRKTSYLRCDLPRSASEAVALTDILRITTAAVALERARREERKRAALWPSDSKVEDTGALYVAEEMQALLETARRVASANIPVLITGETGTGKEVLARLIHGYSPRSAKTFLPFNCSATPRDMLDAQLFGHRRGAFTGATENFQGVIRAATGGTLFLDEIGESTLEIQPKLLRFLESGEVHPIGETHPQRVDVRIIAATNADVDTLVAQGRFREDLYYRLNIVRLHIPPLRERRVEIPVFANHYLHKYAKEMHKGELRLAEETMEYLVLYRWPGNVRQIANEMRRLAALAEHGAVLMPEHLSPDIAASRRTVPPAERALDVSEIVVRIDQPLSAATQHVEQTMIKAAIEKTNSVDEAAKLLGLSRKGLYLKRLRFGMAIDRTKDDGDLPTKRVHAGIG
ncbi:MAG TPA: sigma 54-interacting transcriptional regulator [Vicinamibacterales bacterium]|nr:sigma 54-interacting transcriptional regulator [Vicinamibacterales bacterium]